MRSSGLPAIFKCQLLIHARGHGDILRDLILARLGRRPARGP